MGRGEKRHSEGGKRLLNKSFEEKKANQYPLIWSANLNANSHIRRSQIGACALAGQGQKQPVCEKKKEKDVKSWHWQNKWCDRQGN